MEEVVITLRNRTEILLVDSIEREFLSSFDNLMLILIGLARFVSFGFILGTNVSMIIFIMRQESKTFLDWMIVFHCVLCLGNLNVIIFTLSLSEYWDGFCIFHSFFVFFVNLCKRLLTLGIAIYRLTLVLGSSLVWTSYQRKSFEKFIFLSILLTSVYLTGWAVYYREDYKTFLSMPNKLKYLMLFNVMPYPAWIVKRLLRFTVCCQAQVQVQVMWRQVKVRWRQEGQR